MKEPPPEIFNTDHGSQYTGTAFTDRLKVAGIRISRDGRRRTLDNRMAEYRFCSVLHGGLRTALQLHTVLTQPVLKHYALNRNRNLSKELDHFTKSPIMNKLSGASTKTTLSQAC